MDQFAQMLDFPTLDDRFLRLLAGHCRKAHSTRKLELAARGPAARASKPLPAPVPGGPQDTM